MSGPPHGSSPPGAEPPNPGPGLVFEPNRPPAAARPAATVIVLRQAPAGLEVFCVVRNPRSGFLGGAVVFPGGKVDDADADPRFAELVEPSPHLRLAEIAGADADASALLIAAARESLEESGLLPTSAAPADVEALREAIERQGFLDALRSCSLRLELGRLVPFARWVTPEAEPRRFDARFFLMAHPEGQTARPCETETTHGFWAAPKDVLARFHRGDLQLAPPTTRCLELLAPVTTLERAFELAAEQTLRPICPAFVPQDPPLLALPGDPAHPITERRVAGATRFALRDGRFVSEDPPAP